MTVRMVQDVELDTASIDELCLEHEKSYPRIRRSGRRGR
jgi:hypothetical protein